jgi:hypothetical protein
MGITLIAGDHGKKRKQVTGATQYRRWHNEDNRSATSGGLQKLSRSRADEFRKDAEDKDRSTPVKTTQNLVP